MFKFFRAWCAASLFMLPLSAMIGCEVDVDEDPIEEAGDAIEDAGDEIEDATDE